MNSFWIVLELKKQNYAYRNSLHSKIHEQIHNELLNKNKEQVQNTSIVL